MKKFLNYLMLSLLFVGAMSCENEDYQGPIPYPTLMEAAEDAGLTTLVAAVRAVPGLEAALQDQQAITVFAPTNDAFANALDATDLNDLMDGLLDPLQFYRINRSVIVNLDSLIEMRPYTNERLSLSMNIQKNKADLVVAREKVSDFKNWINQ